MSNTERHLLLCREFGAQGYIMEKFRKLPIYSLQEEALLVHYGHRTKDPYNLGLIDANDVDSLEIIDELYGVKPDFIMFYKNTFKWNKKRNRLIGYPDLIVEVWSDGNTKLDREEKFLIYSNSNGNTEHWYIVQNSNQVECFIGEKRLENQSLTSVLRTIGGIEFDLTNLAL